MMFKIHTNVVCVDFSTTKTKNSDLEIYGKKQKQTHSSNSNRSPEKINDKKTCFNHHHHHHLYQFKKNYSIFFRLADSIHSFAMAYRCFCLFEHLCKMKKKFGEISFFSSSSSS